MAATKARLEARIDPELDEFIEEAARQLHVTKTAFVTETLREAAMRVTAFCRSGPVPPSVWFSLQARSAKSGT